MTAPIYFLTVQRDVDGGPLEWLFGASKKPAWAYLVGCVQTVDGLQHTSITAYGTGFPSLMAAFEAGEPVLARHESPSVDLALPIARDDEAMRLQIQANGRDPHCQGVY